MCAPATLSIIAIGLLTTITARAELLVSIYPLQGDGVDSETTAQLDELLRTEASELPALIVQSKAKTQRAIRRVTGAEESCEGRLACLIEVGEVSAANFLIYGTVAREPDAFQVDLTMVDVVKESIVRQVSTRVAGDAQGVTARARELLIELVLPEQYGGTLAISSLIPGARVLLDGLEIGITPMEPVTGLRPRDYKLGVTLGGTEPFESSISIHPGGTANLSIEPRGETLSVAVDHEEGRLALGPIPDVAHLLAAKLDQPSSPPSAPGSATPPPAMVADAPGLTGGAARQDEPDPDQETSVLFLTGAAVGAGGAVAGVIGGVALAGFGLAQAQASGALTDQEVVTDQEAYDAIDESRGMYEGLGTAGAVLLPLGLTALVGGLGLALWDVTSGSTSEQ